MTSEKYYLAEDYDSGIDYSDGRVVSIMPEASFKLGEAGISYTTIDDYYNEKQIREDEEQYFFDQLDWFREFDLFLRSHIRYCARHNIRLAYSFYNKMKYFVDAAIIQSFIMKEFIRSIPSGVKICYVRVKSETADTPSIQAFTDDGRTTFLPNILTRLVEQLGDISLVFYDSYVNKAEAVDAPPLSLRVKKLIRSLPVKRHAKLLYHFFKYKKHRLFFSGYVGKKNAKRVLFFHSGNAYMDLPMQRLMEGSDDVYYLSDNIIYRCNDLLERPLWKIEKKCGDSIIHKEILDDCQKAAERFSLGSSICAWIDKKAGMKISDFLLPYIKYFISTTCPEMFYRSLSFEGFLTKYRIDYIVGLGSSDINSKSILIAAQKLKKIKSVGIQHGIEAYSDRIWDVTDIDAFDYYFAADGISEKRHRKSLELDYVSPCVIYNSSHYLKCFRAKRSQPRKRNSGKRVLYIPTKLGIYTRFFNNATYPIQWYFEYQKKIIDMFGTRGNYEFIFKRANTQNRWSEQSTQPYLLKKGYPNIKVEMKPMVSYAGKVDAVIIDRPTTAIFEAAMMGIPFICLYPDMVEKQICPDSASLFGETLCRFDSSESAINIINDFLDSLGTSVEDKYKVKVPLGDDDIFEMLHNPTSSVGIIIQCRYNSTRLPGKILTKIKGKEVLGYIIERLSCARSTNNIVVATSTQEDDNAIAKFCRAHGVKCFRGPKDDVASRLLACAEDSGFDYFVRICGDNILTDYGIIDDMIDIALKGGYNMVSNLRERTFPKGISVEVLKTDFFKNIITRIKTDTDKEHVTSYLYAHESEIDRCYYFYNNICPEAAQIKLALDDENDLSFISALIGRMDKNHTQYRLKDIYELSKCILSEAGKVS